jgi:hypothetical protein
VNDNGFIVLLAFGATLLAGILTIAHVSAYRLNKRLELRRQRAAAVEPELDFTGRDLRDIDAPTIAVKVRHAETAR